MNDDLITKIESVLEQNVRPQLLKHYGNVELLSFLDGVLSIKLSGQCSNCPSAKFTVEEFIEKELVEHVTEIEKVKLIECVSEDIINFAKNILNGKSK